MITFKKIKWKNLLSTGDHFTEVNLDTHRTTVLMGTNGAGKCLRGSTLIEIQFKTKEAEEAYKKFMNDY